VGRDWGRLALERAFVWAVTVTGTNASDFGVISACRLDPQPGDNCTVRVAGAPDRRGSDCVAGYRVARGDFAAERGSIAAPGWRRELPGL
jgi:hypothetical protein